MKKEGLTHQKWKSNYNVRDFLTFKIFHKSDYFEMKNEKQKN